MNNNLNYKNELLSRLLKFSVSIIRLTTKLPRNAAGFAIANQVIRSATSIGANCQEAQDAISSKDFLHSINISLKEAKETRYWLLVIKEANLIPARIVEVELAESNQIVAILISSVKSLKKKIAGK